MTINCQREGVGDAIQFSRFFPDGATVRIQPELLRLFRLNFPRCEFTTEQGDGVNGSSVPYMLGIRKIPEVPFLKPYGGDSRKRVGMKLQASKRDGRAMDYSLFRPLLRLPVEWHLLDQDKYRPEEADVIQGLPRHVFSDFLDTAEFLQTCSCVVSVDTAVVHLAGALGIPTLLLYPWNQCWRWGRGETSVWYPSLRIFRQSEDRSWHRAMEGIAETLRTST